MKKKGFPVQEGMLIEFVVEEGKGLIREKAKRLDELKKGYDVDYYLNNQLIPAVSSILQVLGVEEDELFKESSQKGLGSFV
jgi:DNA polymerase I